MALVEELLSHLRLPAGAKLDWEPDSEVARFYRKRSVLITGATGFVGKFIVEKLLRSCPEIGRLYLLIRDKRGRSAEERWRSVVASSKLFDRLKLREGGQSALESKISVIRGDVTEPLFGISGEDFEQLSRDVSIVFNSAASVRFDEPLDAAVRNNVYSVSQLVAVCDRLANLEAILHISTAYSNCHKRDPIYEIFYEPPIGGEQILEAVRGLVKLREQIHRYPEVESGTSAPARPSDQDDFRALERDACRHQRYAALGEREYDLLEEVTRVFLKTTNRPNAYTLTKAIAENYLLELCAKQPERYLNGRIPLAIVRPSIICAALRDPEPGYVDSYNGPSGPIVGLYLGFIQAMPGIGERVSDFIPVDVVSNMLICCGAQLVGKNNDNQQQQPTMDKGAFVFNICSSYRNPVKWGVTTDTIKVVADKFPTKFMFRIASSYFIEDGPFYALYDKLNHKFVGLFVDFVRQKLLRQTLTPATSAYETYKKFHLISRTLCTFSANEWCFQDRNVHQLLQNLSPLDRELFQFDVTKINWNDYIFNYVLGLRLNILKDPPESAPRALAHLQKRKLVYNSTLIGLILALCFLLAGFF